MSLKDKSLKISKPIRNNELNYYVDIVVPFHGEYHLVIKLVESIIRLVRLPKYQIVLVDDGSRSPNIEQTFSKMEGVKVIRHEKPMGFAACVNMAVRASKTDFICVMHSDVEVTQPNALLNLSQALLNFKNEKVAFVSAKTNNPMSKECGFLKAGEPEAGSCEVLTADQYLPFYCTMFSRPVFMKLGGFYEFPYCWFEDKLLSKKCHAAGYRMAYDPQTFVKHHGGSTIKTLVNSDPTILDKIKANYANYQDELKLLKLL